MPRTKFVEGQLFYLGKLANSWMGVGVAPEINSDGSGPCSTSTQHAI